MLAPWERYQRQAAEGPWSKYQKPADTAAPSDTDAVSKARVLSGGILEGIPVVGPLIRGGVERAAALTLAPFSDQNYSQILDRIQQGSEAEKEANPKLNTGAQLTGAVAGTAPMVMAAPAAFGAGGGNLLLRSGASALTGAGIGGADAAVRSGGDPNAAINGLKWGAGLGLLGPAAGEVIGAGVRAVANRVGSGTTAAERLFSRAAGADDVTDVTSRLSSMGPDAMPMDLGPNLQRQAGALAASPGTAQRVVRDAIGTRQAGAGQRVTGAMDEALGGPVDASAMADEIISKAKATAGPLYDAAYSKPIPWTRTLEYLLKRPSAADALRKAQRMAADEGLPSKQWFAQVADDGTVNIKNVPDVRQLDLTKRALDDMHSAAKRAGNDNEARLLDNIRKGILQQMDNHVPEYAAARKAYSGPAQVRDALEEGQNAFASNLTPNQLRAQMLKMGGAEKEAFVQGARSKVSQIMGTARNDALAARSAFQKGWNKEKLEVLVGKDQASKLLDSLDAETAFTKTRDVVTGNSETAARLAAQQDVGAGARNPGVLERAANMDFGTAAARMSDKLFGNARSAAQQRTNTELANLLASNDKTSLNRAIQLVRAAQKRGDIAADKANLITRSVFTAFAQKRSPFEVMAASPSP
ncbi:hypothetical protein [Mesorhizobium sp. A556]